MSCTLIPTVHHIILVISFFNILQGLTVENPMIIPQPRISAENGLVTFLANWTLGTDVVYTLEYGDGAVPIYEWVWSERGHITRFDLHETTQGHVYTDIGNYTATLTIGNTVGNQRLQTDITVEPILKGHINAVVLSEPHATPTVVTFAIQPLVSTTFPMQVWCDVMFGDDVTATIYGVVDGAGLEFHHNYTEDVADVTVVVECHNHVSSISMDVLVVLQDRIGGLETHTTHTAFLTHHKALFNVSMVNGSHSTFTFDFGDGTVEDFTHPLRLSYLTTHQISHVYSSPDNYTVRIVAWNAHFNDTDIVEDVIILNEVHPLVVSGPAVVKVPPGGASFTLTPLDTTQHPPSHVFCTWHLSPVTVIHQYSTEVMHNLPVSEGHQYTRDDVGGNLSVNVTCANLASKQVTNITCVVQEEITGVLVIPVPGSTTPGDLINITISVWNGSDVSFSVDYGDGHTDSGNHPHLFANSSMMVFQHAYDVIGNYSLYITSSNLVSSMESTTQVVIQNHINNLTMVAPELVLWPPAAVVFNITAGGTQNLLEHVHCAWDMDSGLSHYSYIDSLDVGETESNTYIFPRSSIGNVSVSANCSNMVSHLRMDINVTIIFDQVLLDSLVHNGSVPWNSTSEIILDIKRFGSHSCFLFDMGDDVTRLIYGLPECEVNATTEGIAFIQIPSGQMRIVHSYVYEPLCEDTGRCNYVASVYAFNHVSNDTVEVEVEVLDWPCLTPNISIPDIFNHPNTPYIHMKSKPLVVTPNISIDCLKTQDYLTRWEVFERGASTVFLTQTTEEFIYTTRMLPYGDYEVRLTVAMVDDFFNVVKHERNTMVYLQIVKTPLAVAISGNSSLFLKYNRTLVLDALNVTYDPDVELDKQMSGLTFTWLCRRADEVWPMDGDFISRTTLFKSEFHPFYQYGGCFGFGNAVLETTAGVFDNTTLDMLPMTE